MIRRLFAIFLISWPALAAAQLSGHFYLEKSIFAPGEPIFLYFEVVNDGTEAESIQSADPYSFCSGYQIKVSSDPSATSSCAVGFAGDCLFSSRVLAPGKKDVERLLLNFDHKIGAPGSYSVDVERRLPYAATREKFFSLPTARDTLEVQDTLYFQINPNAAEDPNALQSFVALLKSNDPNKRREAARTLASLAPKSLQDVLLTFADNPEFRQFAPLAFHRLNTKRSMRALANLLKATEVGTYENIKSADYLAESNDLQWLPLLQGLAQQHAQISNYLDDAAELGGVRMLSTLISLLSSPDKEYTRLNAVTAMGYTGSRGAVPILLNLLQSPDRNIAGSARFALQKLTHRNASNDQSASPQSEYPKWSQWWARDEFSAPIYKAAECGDFTPLP